MDEKIIKYAKRLSDLGDLIISISDLIQPYDSLQKLSRESLVNYKKEMNTTIERFEYVLDSLIELESPEEVKEEHEKLIGEFKQYIDSIKKLNSSYDIEGNIDKNEYNKGMEMMENSVTNIKIISDLIGEKLLNKIQGT